MPGNTFVGRQNELGRLEQLLDDAREGHGQVAFVVGEAGAGKTSMVKELPDQPGTVNPNLDQEKIFQQYTDVLRVLAQSRTLILILDDLHWADNASLSLLFHLARSLRDSRILIIGTYRPDDVALGRGG